MQNNFKKCNLYFSIKDNKLKNKYIAFYYIFRYWRKLTLT